MSTGLAMAVNLLSVWRLSQEDQEEVIDLAHQRLRIARGMTTRQPYWNDSFKKPKIWWEVRAIGAEFAYWRLTDGVRAAEGAPWDVVVLDQYRVDVKWTPWDGGVLLVKEQAWTNGRPDYFVLFKGEFPVFEYKGRIEAARLLARPLSDGREFGVRFKEPGHAAAEADLEQDLHNWPDQPEPIQEPEWDW